MKLRLFTVLYRYTYPFTAWGEVPGHENYPEEVKRARLYGRDAGWATDQVQFRVYAARNRQEVVERCERSACPGWGTQILCIWEGAQMPVFYSTCVLTLSEEETEKEIDKVAAQTEQR